MDKDTHAAYNETVERISKLEPRGIFYAAVSVPCFEYWLLLHFKYTTKPYAATGNSSVGDAVLKELKEVMPKYKKNDNNIFKSLSSKIETAKTNAAKSLKDAKNSK
ncbi:MAG: RloB domain-containing protein [Arenicellales bacterium WSBS_2016_MAG_OTU3]